MENVSSNKITQKNKSLFIRYGLTLIGFLGVYLIISFHFLLSVKVAHFLGDAAYIPPSVLRYTAIFYHDSEISVLVELIFLIIWLAFLGLTCWGMFKIGLMFVKLIGFSKKEFFTPFRNAFHSLLPTLVLSLLTLSITPIRGYKYDTSSMSEIAERISFTSFLSAMDVGTIAIFGLTFFVILTMTTSFFVAKFLPDNVPMLLLSIFVGVLVSVAVMMFLMPIGIQGFEFIKRQTGDSYLSHFALFGVYSLISAILVLPIKRGKTIREKLPD